MESNLTDMDQSGYFSLTYVPLVGVKDGWECKLIMPYTFQIPELISSLAKAKN